MSRKATVERRKRKALTRITVERLKPPADKAQRVERYDGIVPGFGVRITHDGNRSWIFLYTSPTLAKRRRYTIGRVEFGEPDGVASLDLEQARAAASKLRTAVAAGTDPADVRVADQAAAVAKMATAEVVTFKAVFDLFDKRKLASERRGWEVRQIIVRELIPHWGSKPIGAITPTDVQHRIDALVEAGHEPSAHRLFEIIRRMFNWAAMRPSLNLDRVPTERMKPKLMIGKKTRRKRVLSPDEIGALWRASARIEYPYGALVRLLLLTGLRLTEAAQAVWGEFDDTVRAWTIPAERMKRDDPHVVPLTDDALAVLTAMPRFSGEFLFTCGDGSAPVTSFSKPKLRLDRLMLEELQALAIQRGLDPTKVTLANWEMGRDIRRTVRTNLSALPVPDMIRELVIAHAQPELHQVYDQYAYLDEKREALTLWAARLRSFVQPPPTNVVALRRAVAI
jgi:integrase